MQVQGVPTFSKFIIFDFFGRFNLLMQLDVIFSITSLVGGKLWETREKTLVQTMLIITLELDLRTGALSRVWFSQVHS